MNQDVLFMYGVFILYFLIPIVPTVIIYKLFPDSRVSASGPLSGLTIKTSGAFAAYVIALVSGVFIVNNTIEIIKESIKLKKESVNYLWEVRSSFNIYQGDSIVTPSAKKDVMSNMKVNLTPQPVQYVSSEDYHIAYVSDRSIKDNVVIEYSAPNCETPLGFPLNSSHYRRDELRKIIFLDNILVRKAPDSLPFYKSNETLKSQPQPNI